MRHSGLRGLTELRNAAIENSVRPLYLRFVFGSGERGEMGGRIWVVTNGAPDAPPLAYFSDGPRAAEYRELLVERYGMGKNLSLHGRPIADDAGTWELGLGPVVLERSVDDAIDSLPGAWCVKVDESLRMVACQFSTQFRVTKSADHYRTGIHAICQAYGPTPHAALDAARKAMIAYLGRNHSWR